MIIGRTITSLLYAWRLQKKCILVEPFCFHPLSDEFDGIDFSEFNVSNPQELLNNLLFTMGITNLLLHQGNVSSFREEDNTIITKHNTRIQIKEEVEIFDLKPTGMNQVFDEFYWRSGTPHDNLLFETEDELCSRIHFYQNKRLKVKNVVKDFTVVSNLSENQLLDADYGNGIVRIKTARIFKQRGLKGEFSWQRGETKYYRKIKFDFVGREVLPRIEQKLSFKEVYNMKQKEGKEWIMWKRLMSKEKTWLG